MESRTEHVIRQWGKPTINSSGLLVGKTVEVAQATARPTEECLTYSQAAAATAGEVTMPPGQASHVDACCFCQRLLDEFRQARSEPHQPVRQARPVRMRWPMLAAAGVVLLLAAGLILLLNLPTRSEPAMAWADVGRASDVEAGLTPRAGQSFAGGEAIMFRIQLRQPRYVMLLNLTPQGELTALPPLNDTASLAPSAGPGTIRLGPLRLDEAVGRETFFVVAMAAPPASPIEHEARLRQLRQQHKDPEALAKAIRAWPAEVEIISFDHVAGQ